LPHKRTTKLEKENKKVVDNSDFNKYNIKVAEKKQQ
jgi:hypothetical protein